MATTRGQLRDLVAAALVGRTDAGPRVYTPADWPTWRSEYPVILVRAPSEVKESQGRGSVLFTVTGTILIVYKVQASAQANDAGALQAEEALERLETQIVQRVINNPTLIGPGRLIQQYPEIRSGFDVDSSGETHLGEGHVELDMQWVEGPEDFFPDAVLPLLGADVTLTEGAGGETLAGATINLPQS
jgi:hypothetical protein